MKMQNEWAASLAEKGIKFEDTSDRIIFYDPYENSRHVVIREHLKFKVDLQGYSSKRIGTMTFKEFESKFNVKL